MIPSDQPNDEQPQQPPEIITINVPLECIKTLMAHSATCCPNCVSGILLATMGSWMAGYGVRIGREINPHIMGDKDIERLKATITQFVTTIENQFAEIAEETSQRASETN